MSALTLTTVSSLDTSLLANINANSAAIVSAMNDTLSKSGKLPNQMLSNLDMNSNRILNLPTPVNNLEPVRLSDLNSVRINAGNIPKGGTVNQILAKKSSTDYDTLWETPPLVGNVPQVFDVHFYGAKCDNLTDDTAAFNAAIAALGGAPGILYLPSGSGNCCVRGGITVPAAVRFVGAQNGTSLISVCGADAPAVSMPNGSSTLEYLLISGKNGDTFYSTIKLTGSVVAAEVVTIKITPIGVAGGATTLSYTTQTGDTLATVAAAFATLINNNSTLATQGYLGFSSAYSQGTFIEIFNGSVATGHTTFTLTSSAHTTLTDWTFGATYPALDATGCAECFISNVYTEGGNYGLKGPSDSLTIGSHFNAGYLGIGYLQNGSFFVRNSFDFGPPFLPSQGTIPSISAWQSNHAYTCSSAVPCVVSVSQTVGPQAGSTFYIMSGASGTSGTVQPGTPPVNLQFYNVDILDNTMTWRLYALTTGANIVLTSFPGNADSEHSLMFNDAGGMPNCLRIDSTGGLSPSAVRYGPGSFCTAPMNQAIAISGAANDIDIFDSLITGGWLGANGASPISINITGAGIRIHDNNITSGDCAVNISGGTNISIIGNNISGSTVAALCASAGTGINFSNNTTDQFTHTSWALSGTVDFVSILGNQVGSIVAAPTNTSTGTHISILHNPGISDFVTNTLAADVAITVVNTYVTGPIVAQGSMGTWFASGTVTLQDPTNAPLFHCKLWDGTTVIASSSNQEAVTEAATISLHGYLSAPAGSIRISCTNGFSTTSSIKANYSGNAKDSVLTAIRIA